MIRIIISLFLFMVLSACSMPMGSDVGYYNGSSFLNCLSSMTAKNNDYYKYLKSVRINKVHFRYNTHHYKKPHAHPTSRHRVKR